MSLPEQRLWCKVCSDAFGYEVPFFSREYARIVIVVLVGYKVQCVLAEVGYAFTRCVLKQVGDV